MASLIYVTFSFPNCTGVNLEPKVHQCTPACLPAGVALVTDPVLVPAFRNEALSFNTIQSWKKNNNAVRKVVLVF